MQFVLTAKRSPKGLRVPSELNVPVEGKAIQGEFVIPDAASPVIVLKFNDGTKVAMLLQKVASYTPKQPAEDALAKYLALPQDNDDDEAPLNPPAK